MINDIITLSDATSYDIEDIWFFHSWTPQTVFSLVATATREDTAYGVDSVK